MDQRSGIQIPVINLYVYGQLTYHKSTKIIQWRQEQCLTNHAETTGYQYANSRARSLPYLHCIPKWTENAPNAEMREQYKIIKSFENNIGVNHYDLELVNGLLDILKIQVKTIKITFIKASCFAYQETKKVSLQGNSICKSCIWWGSGI